MLVPLTCKRCCFDVFLPRLLLFQELNGPRSSCGFPEEIMILSGRHIVIGISMLPVLSSTLPESCCSCFHPKYYSWRIILKLLNSWHKCVKGGELHHLPMVFMSGFSSHFLTTMSEL